MKSQSQPKRRQALGSDPFAGVIPSISALTRPAAVAELPDDESSEPAAPIARSSAAPPPQQIMPSAKGVRVRATFHLEDDLLEQVRDAVFQLSGPPHCMSLSSFTESAFRRELERLQKETRDGEPFAPRTSQLRGGRRIQ